MAIQDKHQTTCPKQCVVQPWVGRSLGDIQWWWVGTCVTACAIVYLSSCLYIRTIQWRHDLSVRHLISDLFQHTSERHRWSPGGVKYNTSAVHRVLHSTVHLRKLFKSHLCIWSRVHEQCPSFPPIQIGLSGPHTHTVYFLDNYNLPDRPATSQ